MARYSRGKRAVLMDDIFGRKIKYKDARTQWDGKRVYKGDFTPKHPQLEPQKYMKLDGTDALKNSRPDNDGANQTVTIELGSLHGKFSGQMAIQPPPRPPQLGLSLLDTPVTGLEATAEFTLTANQLNFIEDAPGFGMTSGHGVTGLFFNFTEVPPSQHATTSQGTVSFNLAETPDGLSATASVGTLQFSAQEDAVGGSATAQQGTLEFNAVENAIGSQANTSQGTITPAQIEEAEGQQASSGQGSIVFNFADQPDGIAANSAQGTVGFLVGNTIVPDDQEATVQQGTPGLLQAEEVSGIAATASEGTASVILNFTENVPGLGMTSAHGGLGFRFNFVEVPPGIQAASQQGTIAINTAHPVSGLSSTAERGTIAVAFPGYGLNPWGHGKWGQ